MHKYIVMIAVLLYVHFSCGQAESNTDHEDGLLRIHEKGKYLEDFDEMVDLLLTHHPRPYSHITEEAFQELVNTEKLKISESTTLGEFYWICRSIVSSIGCGHTRVFNRSIAFPNELKFPLHVKFIKSKLYVIDPLLNENQVKKGDEILSINTVPVSKLRAQIFEHLPADGHNRSFKQAFINKYFSVYCSYQLDFPELFEIQIKDGDEKVVLNPSADFPPIEILKSECLEKLCYKKLKSDIGLMTIKGFGYYGADYEIFKSFIDKSIKKLGEEKIENLIIDVRGNNGGEAYCASYLLQHLLPNEFIYFTKNSIGYESLKKPLQPLSNGFKGNTYILIDGDCFSTTTHFLALLKEHNYGTMIGTEAGGTYICNDNSTTIDLPNTNLSLRVARNVYEVNAVGLDSRRGVLPDSTVSLEIEDYIAQNDAILNFALDLIVGSSTKQ